MDKLYQIASEHGVTLWQVLTFMASNKVSNSSGKRRRGSGSQQHLLWEDRGEVGLPLFLGAKKLGVLCEYDIGNCCLPI